MNKRDTNKKGKFQTKSSGVSKRSLDKKVSKKNKFDTKKSNDTSKDIKPIKDLKATVLKRSKGTDELRLNKYIANTGICSRRDADIYIQSGNVKVNGEVVTEMGYLIKITDAVQFDGVLLAPGKKEYVILNKPKGFTTASDGENALRNVLELVKNATKENIQPVGRMDKNTTGLLLFTNDNDILRKLTMPNQKNSKIYQVTLDRNLKYEDLEKIVSGIKLDEHRVNVEEINYVEGEPKSEIGIKLRTSNVKIVRAIFEHLKYNVLKVDRVSYVGLTKKNLQRGHWRFLTEQEIINMKNMC